MVWSQQDMGLESILGHDVSRYHAKDQNMPDLAIRRQNQPINCRGPQQAIIDSMSHGTYDQVGQSEKDTGVRKNKKTRDVDTHGHSPWNPALRVIGAQKGHKMTTTSERCGILSGMVVSTRVAKGEPVEVNAIGVDPG